MIEGIKSLLNIQTAETKSEPTKIENEEVNSESTEEELVLITDAEVKLVEYQCIKRVFAKPMNRVEAERLGLVRDVTGEDEEGYFVKYSEEYSSWSPKQVFNDGYIIPKPAHICKNKCDSCEFDYAERSCV